MAPRRISLSIVSYSTNTATPRSTKILASWNWSKRNGIAMTGVAVWIASRVPNRPQWLMNARTFLCSGKIFLKSLVNRIENFKNQTQNFVTWLTYYQSFHYSFVFACLTIQSKNLLELMSDSRNDKTVFPGKCFQMWMCSANMTQLKVGEFSQIVDCVRLIPSLRIIGKCDSPHHAPDYTAEWQNGDFYSS